MLKSVIINGFHMYNDFGLVLASKKINPAKPKTKYINIPAGNGSIDATEAVNDEVVYEDRTIELKFVLNTKFEYQAEKVTEIWNKFHGKRVRFVFEDDQNYYYQGRVIDGSWDMSKYALSMTIEAQPFKYNVDDSSEPWKWDPFSFINGVIKPYIVDRAINGSENIVFPAGNLHIIPIFDTQISSGQSLSISYKSKNYNLLNGKNRFPDIKINGDEEVTITVTGNGILSVVYRDGLL